MDFVRTISRLKFGNLLKIWQHEYQIFSDRELSRSFDEHINACPFCCAANPYYKLTLFIQFACTYKQSLPAYSSGNLYTILGEWSNAVTDCARWLNGRGVGARWDNTRFPGSDTSYHGSCDDFTGSYKGWSDSYRRFLRKLVSVSSLWAGKLTFWT